MKFIVKRLHKHCEIGPGVTGCNVVTTEATQAESFHELLLRLVRDCPSQDGVKIISIVEA